MEVAIGQSQKPLIDMLMDSKVISQAQLQQALAEQDDEHSLEEVLIAQGLVTLEQLAILTSLQLHVPFVNLKKQGIDPKAVELVPEWLCRKYGVVPLRVTDDALVMAMEGPADIQSIDELAAHTRKRIEPVLALRRDIQEAVDMNYRVSGEIERQLTQIPTMTAGAKDEDGLSSLEAIHEAPVVQAIDLLIRQASRDRALDIHVEP